MTASMTPLPYKVITRHVDTVDTVTLALRQVRAGIPVHRPGQFTMMYAFGVGEVPISISSMPDGDVIVQTLRAVGAVTQALCDAQPGTIIGLRGPFGTDWGLPCPEGGDVLVVAGGIGLAPLRPVVEHLLADRDRYRSARLLIGARTPGDLLYTAQYDDWRARGVDVQVSVDKGDADWTGRVGLVTTLYEDLDIDAAATTAFLCGPEIMMHFGALGLLQRGLPAASIRLSLERNMRCGVGICGHCQLGPLLVCRDGPVITHDRAEPLLAVKEL